MAQYFFGPDTYEARHALDTVAASIPAHLHFIDREYLETTSWDDSLAQSTQGLFGKELLVVRDPSLLPKHIQEVLVASLKKHPQATWVVWDRVSPDKKTSFWKTFKAVAKEFPSLSQGALTDWLVAEAKVEGSTLEPMAAQELAVRVGPDRWQLVQELKKLSATHDLITKDHVRQEVLRGEEVTNVFAMLDALVRGDGATALQELDAALATGESEFRLLSLLAYQVRVMFLLVTSGQGHSAKDVAAKTGLHPFVVEKNMRITSRISPSLATDMYTRLLATDFSIKQGIVDPRTGLTMLVVGLAQSFQPQKTHTP